MHVKEGYFFIPPKQVTSPTCGPPPQCKQALRDHMEQSSNSSELLATFSEYFVMTVMRHPSSWESLDLLVFRRSPLG